MIMYRVTISGPWWERLGDLRNRSDLSTVVVVVVVVVVVILIELTIPARILPHRAVLQSVKLVVT
jgi:hypothetical protein